MQNTQKLLSIRNLKKYFPIAKSSIFQKEQFYSLQRCQVILPGEDCIEVYLGHPQVCQQILHPFQRCYHT